MSYAAAIILHPWFLPGYVGLLAGFLGGVATCFFADWRIQRGYEKLRRRRLS